MLRRQGKMTGDGPSKPLIVVNEILYYVQNANNILHRNDIVSIAEEYFTKEDIEGAKTIQWNSAGKFTESYRFVKRTGISACNRNINDIIDIIKSIDSNKGMIRYASIDVTKVPPISPDHRDLGLLRGEMKDVKNKVEFRLWRIFRSSTGLDLKKIGKLLDE